MVKTSEIRHKEFLDTLKKSERKKADSTFADDEFRFTGLTGDIKKEVLDLKNDVLKLCDNMDNVKQQVINLNAKVKFNNREILLMIEDIMEKIK